MRSLFQSLREAAAAYEGGGERGRVCSLAGGWVGELERKKNRSPRGGCGRDKGNFSFHRAGNQSGARVQFSFSRYMFRHELNCYEDPCFELPCDFAGVLLLLHFILRSFLILKLSIDTC
jgi:hypothetical protein